MPVNRCFVQTTSIRKKVTASPTLDRCPLSSLLFGLKNLARTKYAVDFIIELKECERYFGSVIV